MRSSVVSGFSAGFLVALAVGFSLSLISVPRVVRAQAVGSTTGVASAADLSARFVAHPTETDVAPTIDGKLDDAPWGKATPLGEFVQREPREGQPVSERTEVRILMDKDAIYIAAWLYDKNPEQIIVGEKLRDAELTKSDYFAVILDTYFDRQNGFVFATTPAGIEYDGQVVKEGEGGGVNQPGQTRQQSGAMGGFNLNWDATWKVASSTDAQGWYAEMRIPFSTLRYGGGKTQQWGMNVVRSIRRRNEESFWAPIPRQFNLYRLSKAGTLSGLQVPSTRQATITPYILGSVKRDYLVANSDVDWPREFGVDAKLGLTPSLTLDATYNTDFAQVEVDEQRTNLTRFPLFFPEKRPFFLENAGIFSAGTPQAADLFFTRKIGISPTGEPVPIIGGGRLTGRAGGVGVGLLQLFTDDLGAVPENSFTVARLSRELPNRSRLGGMFVQRIATQNGSDHNRTYALDGRIGIKDAWTFDWWAAATETPGRNGREQGLNGRIAFVTRDWNNNIRFQQIGDNFNPEVGFVNRVGYRQYEFQLMRFFRVPSIPYIRQFNPHINYRSFFDFSGFQETGYVHFDVEAEFANGGRIGPELNIYREGLKTPFVIGVDKNGQNVVLPPGTYDFVGNGWDIATDPSATLSMITRLDLGPFYNGTRWGGNSTITLRRGASLTTSIRVDYNSVHLDQGDFKATLLGFRFGYFFTPRIFLSSLFQYSNQVNVWSANVRFGWLNTAGTGLFIVYNEGQQTNGFTDLVRPMSRALTFKFTRQFGLGS